MSKSRPATKLGVFGFLARIYNSLYYLAPAIIRLKFLFQSLCEMRYNWDTPMSDELKDKHFKSLGELKDLKAVNLL